MIPGLSWHGYNLSKLSFGGCFNRSTHCKLIFSPLKMGRSRERGEENHSILKQPLQMHPVFCILLHNSKDIPGMLRVLQNLGALEPLSSISFMACTKMDSHQDNVNFIEISSLTSFFLFLS